MPRPRRAARGRRLPITEAERLWAYDALEDDHPDYADVEFFTTDKRVYEVWLELRDEVLEAWIKRRPGTRPERWWTYEAPEEGRHRLGGTGTPEAEVHAGETGLVMGIPELWVSAWDVSFYNGRMKNVDGEPIGREHSEGDFPHDAIDPADPPLYESQAVYLDRHSLLTDAERAVLDAQGWPEPEAVLPEGVQQ